MESNHRVGKNVTHVDGAAFDDHVGMFFGQQPTDMGKEHASTTVVRVGIRLGEFVVQLCIKQVDLIN